MTKKTTPKAKKTPRTPKLIWKKVAPNEAGWIRGRYINTSYRAFTRSCVLLTGHDFYTGGYQFEVQDGENVIAFGKARDSLRYAKVLAEHAASLPREDREEWQSRLNHLMLFGTAFGPPIMEQRTRPEIAVPMVEATEDGRICGAESASPLLWREILERLDFYARAIPGLADFTVCRHECEDKDPSDPADGLGCDECEDKDPSDPAGGLGCGPSEPWLLDEDEDEREEYTVAQLRRNLLAEDHEVRLEMYPWFNLGYDDLWHHVLDIRVDPAAQRVYLCGHCMEGGHDPE